MLESEEKTLLERFGDLALPMGWFMVGVLVGGPILGLLPVLIYLSLEKFFSGRKS